MGAQRRSAHMGTSRAPSSTADHCPTGRARKALLIADRRRRGQPTPCADDSGACILLACPSWHPTGGDQFQDVAP
eukprot:9202215-Pyramimonas_sp.AAC.1